MPKGPGVDPAFAVREAPVPEPTYGATIRSGVWKEALSFPAPWR